MNIATTTCFRWFCSVNRYLFQFDVNVYVHLMSFSIQRYVSESPFIFSESNCRWMIGRWIWRSYEEELFPRMMMWRVWYNRWFTLAVHWKGSGLILHKRIEFSKRLPYISWVQFASPRFSGGEKALFKQRRPGCTPRS